MNKEQLSDIDKLRFYRDEVKFEFGLLAMRSTILVTCQSFLVVPFAILQTAVRFQSVLIPTLVIGVLGIFVAMILREPLNAAHRTIEKWVMKQRSLLKKSHTLSDLTIDRDKIPDVETSLKLDRDHVKSLAFSKYGPWAFISFWIAAVLWSIFRAFAGSI
jgi:hypothetical protein